MTAEKALADLIDAHRECPYNATLSYHAWVCTSPKCLCMTIPKVACTKLKKTLFQLEGHAPPEDISKIHDIGKRLTHFKTPQAIEILTSPDWFRFCFVRHPHFRLFSAYKSKIGNRWDTQYEYVREEIRNAHNYPRRAQGPAPLPSFRDFVTYVQNTPDEHRDAHWQTQTAILMQPTIRYDFIGRLETFERDLRTALKRLGAPPALIAEASDRVNPTTEVHHAWAYDRDLAQTAYDVYRDDFEAFGYDPDDWLFDYP